MKHIKKITAAALSVLMLGSLTMPAFAASAPSEKEEVIYIMTDASGKVTDIEAVNIFAGGDITDYGDYSAVKMLTTNDTITQDGDRITFSSDADKVYYQGTMKSTVIPWNIWIRYYLDGKEAAAEDLAGKSGTLEIRFSVSKNEAYTGSFYEDYALQASFTLDTDRCRNIVASGATVANVGSDKQLTYTILPGNGIDTTIRADVTDFIMESVAINGIRLNLNFEVDDTELMDKVDEMISAIGSIDDGAAEVRDGTGKLYDATGTLNEKVGELNDGVGALTDGAGDVYSGLSSIAAKNGYLTDAAYTAYEGLCTAAAAVLNAQLTSNGIETITLTPSNYSAVLLGLLEKMDADAVYNQAYQTALQQVTEQVEAQADELYRGDMEQIRQGTVASLTDAQKSQITDAYIQQMMASDKVISNINAAVATVSAAAKQVSELKDQLDNYGAFYQGLLDYTDAVGDAAAGAQTLKLGMDTLCSNTGTLKVSVGELNDAANELYGGTKELASGTSEFVDKTSDIDTQISDEIDSMLSSVSDGDNETISFVSDKNANVDSVQFVIKTAAIEKAEMTVTTAAEEAPLTFWQKLLRLFGLY